MQGHFIRQILLAILMVATLSTVPAAWGQVTYVEDHGQVWGVQFQLTDLDDEPAVPLDPADDATDDGELFPGIDIGQPETLASDPQFPAPQLLELDIDVAAPARSVVTAAIEAPAVEATQLTRQSQAATTLSGIRRSPISLQPVIRGYHQQSIYAQYQGAQFVPVRFDLDSILTNIDPSLIDNLIIIPGPYGVRYGPGLAFIDVQAKPLPRFDVPTLQGRTSLLVQSNGSQFYGHQLVSGGGLNYGYRAVYNDKVGSDYTSGNGTRIPSAYNLRDFDFAVAWDPNDSSTIQFEYLRQDMSNARFAGLIFDVKIRKTDAYFLRYTNDEGCCGAEWLAEAWWNRTAMVGDNFDEVKREFYKVIYVDEPPFFLGYTDADVTSAGFRIAPTWGADDRAKLTTGVDLHHVDQELNELDDFFFPLNGKVEDFNPSNFPIPRSDMLDVGAFVEATTTFGQDWRITIGARADWVTTRRPAGKRRIARWNEPDDPYYDSYDSLEIENLLLHAFFSAERELGPGLDLRLGFGHGQRPPSLTERFALYPYLTLVQRPGAIAVGHPSLRPEAASQFDAALIGNCDDLRFQLSGFWSFIDEHITLQGGGVFVNADATLAGAEFSIEYDWSPSLTPFANIRYVAGQRLDGGARIGEAPFPQNTEPLPSIYPLESRVGLRWRDPRSNRYGVEFVARFVDAQDRVADSLGELPTEAFTTFDLRGYWQAWENLRFTSGFENFTNENYREHLNVYSPAVLEPGLNFYFTAQVDY